MMSDPVADVLAIDGPSGAGKGAVAGLVARHLGWRLLDSGVPYRAVALAAGRRGIGLGDAAALATLCRRLEVAPCR